MPDSHRGLILLSALALGACSSGDSDNNVSVPAEYQFDSRFVEGSSVAYNGQTCRHTLITALNNAVRDAAEISKADYRSPTAVPYFDDTIAGDLAEQSTQLTLGTDLPVPENLDTLGELCGTSFLKQKYAGNDTVTDFRDWNTQFQGVAGEVSAEAFLRRLITEASEQARDGSQAAGEAHFISPTGIDYAQYIQKLLLGAVPFAQATDDYLDDDPATPGKGLLASAEQSGDNPYSGVEHTWDEGFGYFGAARAYGDRTDDVNRSGVVDDNNDGFLNPRSEHNFGASTNAAKRDVGADPSTPTDFTGDAFLAFRTGRAIITRAGADFADMSEADQNALLAARDSAVDAYEGAIAATVVHYINDVLSNMADIGTPEYSFADHAKHWAEMKAFALGLQFNPASPLHADDGDNPGQSLFVTLHNLMQDAPALTNDAAYRAALLDARALLGNAYNFAQPNLEIW